MDGASRQMGANVSLQLKAPTRERIEQAIRLDFPVSNNEAKYEAILAGIDLTISVSLENIIIQSDSQLVAASLPTKDTVLLPVYYQPESSITTNWVNNIEEVCPSRMTPITHYLSSRELLNSRVEAHKVQVQAARFSLVNGQLYKRSLNGPYLKCLTTQYGQYALAELHEGI